MISAKIIADSINPTGCRLITYVLTYPRFIHAELMTHRMFSRNAASSRAIPASRFRDAALTDPATFEQWTANARGMQGKPIGDAEKECSKVWLDACDTMVAANEELEKLGAHKQNANRLLEPWLHMTAVVSATQWGNFFAQRCHPDAMPEFQVLAYRMLAARLASVPEYIVAGEWHLPFKEHVPEGSGEGTALKICTARCARVSYISFDGVFTTTQDIDLHDKLVLSGHWSPFEHCAKAMAESNWCGNFKGWTQYRKEQPNECQDGMDNHEDLVQLLEKRPSWIEA